MQAPSLLQRTKFLWSNIFTQRPLTPEHTVLVRLYAKKSSDDCQKAIVDMPPEVDPDCPQPCERRQKKKKGILHKIKMKVIEGGTNFGTPFRRVQCQPKVCKESEQPKALPEPKKKLPSVPAPRPGVQVSILGADTAIGQYLALLLKQCPCIKKLRLYEATDTQGSPCNRELCNVVQDLKHIDTNCQVQAFSCACFELERCLQNSDIVLMLESGYISVDMPTEKRFCYQAPIVKKYTDAIAAECPKAFLIVCATPIDCMVPLVAETLKETGWYDPRKVLGSLAVPEMRASTLAARALCLEPRYTRVPCVGGTEGDALVPLFSKAVEYFDFAKHNAELMTHTVRTAPMTVSRCSGMCSKAADLSEAHAIAGLVTKVAYALLCKDVPRVTGFVETDPSHVISPARYLAVDVLLNDKGICTKFDIPILNNYERDLVEKALSHIVTNVEMAQHWHMAYLKQELVECKMAMMTQWFHPKDYDHVKKICHYG
ncbi:unnamed protein product [Chilo suppressalis]|uniref:Malate dehydrogenase, mitochondrial n=1 Tax=Chilo suppressalis TaxID=168631 RepID=A0ABN8B4K9_CHISP|nr:unnamed protein product [Chilo suppressalis]